ncbi:MAG: hypothetical protein ACI9YL_001123 [Luteibaculaceae bacterium]|jgi:hypothetical protein
MISKMFQRIMLGLASVVGLFVLVLGVHIYMVTNPSGEHHNNWQLSRLDFSEEVDGTLVNNAANDIRSMDGIKAVYANEEHKTVVFAYTPGTVEKDEVLQKAFSFSPDVVVFQNPTRENGKAGGCPVIDKNTITYRIGTFFTRIFS